MLSDLIQYFSGFAPAFAFFSGLILGDSSATGFGFLASQGIVPFWTTAFFCFLGMTFADLLYYFFGRTKLFDRFVKSKHFKILFKKVDSAVDHLAHKSPILALFYTKFMFGTKVLVAAYLGDKKVGFLKFLWAAIVSSIMWMSIASTVGYFAGEGFIWILEIFKSLPIAFFSLGIIFLIFFHFHKKASDKLIKKHTRKKKHAKL